MSYFLRVIVFSVALFALLTGCKVIQPGGDECLSSSDAAEALGIKASQECWVVFKGEVTPPPNPPSCEITGKVLLAFYPMEDPDDTDKLITAMVLYVNGSMCGFDGGIGGGDGQRYEGLCVSDSENGDITHVVAVDNSISGIFGAEGDISPSMAKGKLYKLKKNDTATDERWPGYLVDEFLGTYNGTLTGIDVQDVTCPW